MTTTCNGQSYTSNHGSDADCRIVLIWKWLAVVRTLHQSRQSLTCEIQFQNQMPFVFTAIYASNFSKEKELLWKELTGLHLSTGTGGVPWVIGGDFNQILHPSEHSLSAENHLKNDMVKFRDCLLQPRMFDLRFRGVSHTWTNKRPAGPIIEKLDRLLVNNAWLAAFPNSIATFFAPEFSDHSPCCLDLAVPLPTTGSKLFRFINYLIKHPSFGNMVKSSWFDGSPWAMDLASFYVKLKALKRSLKSLNRDKFSNIQLRVSAVFEQLEVAQVHALNNPSAHSF